MKKEDLHVYDEELGTRRYDPAACRLGIPLQRFGLFLRCSLVRSLDLQKMYGFDEKYVQIPLLVNKARIREAKEPGTLPLEQLQLNQLVDGFVSFSQTMSYGELEIFSEGDKVVVTIIGTDDTGSFTAANMYPLTEFMSGTGNWLESAVRETFYYQQHE